MPKHKSKKADSSDSDSGPEDVSYHVHTFIVIRYNFKIYREVQ